MRDIDPDEENALATDALAPESQPTVRGGFGDPDQDLVDALDDFADMATHERMGRLERHHRIHHDDD